MSSRLRRPVGPIRVLSIPSNHVYVRNISCPDGKDEVVRLPDPPVPGAYDAAQWWPPPSLEPRWVNDHRDEFDLAHVHFGFDAIAPKTLAAFVAALRHYGKALVYTAHDLRNPHHHDRAAHDDQLDVLVPAADVVVTLTRGAAEEIRRRWGRRAWVLPHPHVVEEPRLSAPRPVHPGFVVGVHVKSQRASMAPAPVVAALVPLVGQLSGLRLQVNAHTDVVTPGFERYDEQLHETLSQLAHAGCIDLRVHDFLDDEALWDYLQGLDVSVLPYRFGTHSGWLEACYDLGTTVVAPTCGYYAQQRPCLSYGADELGLDALALRRCIREAHGGRPVWRADPEARLRERRSIAEAHRTLYRKVLGR